MGIVVGQCLLGSAEIWQRDNEADKSMGAVWVYWRVPIGT